MFAEITLINYSRPLAERAKARKTVGPYRWTPAKAGGGRAFYQAPNALRMDPRGSSLDLRLSYANEHLSGRLSRTTGYYADACGIDTIKPIIARLPHSRGFLAGWTMGEGMCAALDSDIHDSEEEAAMAAHDMAERDAEKSRESEEEEDEG